MQVDDGAEPAASAAAVGQVLGDPSFAERAAGLAAAIAEETASDRVVAEIEALVARSVAA